MRVDKIIKVKKREYWGFNPRYFIYSNGTIYDRYNKSFVTVCSNGTFNAYSKDDKRSKFSFEKAFKETLYKELIDKGITITLKDKNKPVKNSNFKIVLSGDNVLKLRKYYNFRRNKK